MVGMSTILFSWSLVSSVSVLVLLSIYHWAIDVIVCASVRGSQITVRFCITLWGKLMSLCTDSMYFPQAHLVWSSACRVDHWLSHGMRFHCQTLSLSLTRCKVDWKVQCHTATHPDFALVSGLLTHGIPRSTIIPLANTKWNQFLALEQSRFDDIWNVQNINSPHKHSGQGEFTNLFPKHQQIFVLFFDWWTVVYSHITSEQKS